MRNIPKDSRDERMRLANKSLRGARDARTEPQATGKAWFKR